LLIQDSTPGQEGWIQTERSECLDTGWWRSLAGLGMTGSLTVGNPPPHLVRFASLIGLGTPPVRRGNFGE